MGIFRNKLGHSGRSGHKSFLSGFITSIELGIYALPGANGLPFNSLMLYNYSRGRKPLGKGTEMTDTDRIEEVKAMIIEAIRETMIYTREDVTAIAGLRDSVRATRTEFDQAMIGLATSATITLMTEDNQQALTDSDRYNAVGFAGNSYHAVILN